MRLEAKEARRLIMYFNSCREKAEVEHQTILDKLDAAIERVSPEPQKVEDRIREIHAPVLITMPTMIFHECVECGSLYPCATIRALSCG